MVTLNERPSCVTILLGCLFHVEVVFTVYGHSRSGNGLRLKLLLVQAVPGSSLVQLWLNRKQKACEDFLNYGHPVRNARG